MIYSGDLVDQLIYSGDLVDQLIHSGDLLDQLIYSCDLVDELIYLGDLVDLMVWVYVEDIDQFIDTHLWETYSQAFPRIWAASAFKGIKYNQ